MPCHFFRLPSYPLVKLTLSSSLGFWRLDRRPGRNPCQCGSKQTVQGIVQPSHSPIAVNFSPRNSHIKPEVVSLSFSLGCWVLSVAKSDSSVLAESGLAARNLRIFCQAIEIS